MDHEHIWTLIAKKLAGEARAEDLLELYSMLREEPEIHFSLEIFEEIWSREHRIRERPLAAYARLLQRMEQQGIEFPPGERIALQEPVALNYHFNKKRKKHFVSFNNFKTSVRNLFTNRVYSLIDITGLAIGMAASILILLWIFKTP